MAGNVAARQCRGIKGDGTACRRPPGRGSDFCAFHDPERRDEHIAVSSAGGVARHDPETLSVKDELREIKAALWSRTISPGIATALLQTIRLEREHDADEKRENPNDELITSIRAMRESGDTPDMSEPANDTRGGIPSRPDDVGANDPPHDPDAPRMEDYRRPDGTLNGDAYLRDSHAHKAVPLSHLTVEQRRERFAGHRN